MLSTTLLVFHVMLALLLIALVLMQKEKSGGMMAMGGASQTLFGSQGAGSFMTKLTIIIACLLAFTSLRLGFYYPSAQTDEVAPLFVKSDTQSTSED